MTFPDELRYSEARVSAAVRHSETLYANDDRITPALILGAYDSGMDPVVLADAIDAYHAGILPVSNYKKKKREQRAALAELTRLSQEIGDYT